MSNPPGGIGANQHDYVNYSVITSSVDASGFDYFARAIAGLALYDSTGIVDPADEITGVYGAGVLNATGGTLPLATGVTGEVTSLQAGGIITDARAVYGNVGLSNGAITNTYAGYFTAGGSGTNRYGIYARASGGGTNYAGYFASARVQIDRDSTPDIPQVATGEGDLFVSDAIEADGPLDISGTAVLRGGLVLDNTDENVIDISSPPNQNLRFVPGGVGDSVFVVDSDTNVQIAAQAGPPAVDMVAIVNGGQPITTGGVNALSIYNEVSNATTNGIDITPFFNGGATDNLVYQVLSVNGFSPTNATGIDTVIGLNVSALTDPGATISSHALVLGPGWDSQIRFKDATAIISMEEGGTLTFQDPAGNALFNLRDVGTTGIGAIRRLTGPDNNVLTVDGGSATVIGDAGENLELLGGLNSAGGSGGDGGAVTVRGASAVGDGSVPRRGGDVMLESGNSAIGTGGAGNIRILGGDSTAGPHGNVEIQSGGSPTVIGMDGGDIAVSADDDVFLNSDDDFVMSIASTSAVINVFDDPFLKTIDIGGVTNDAADTISIATNSTTGDTIAIGNAAAGTNVTLAAGGIIDLEGTVTIDLIPISAAQYAVCHTNADTDDEQIGDCSGAPTADYAEQYPVALGIEYGDIVVPGSEEVATQDGSTIVQLVKSSVAYQGPVVGIVSNNYGDFTSAGYNIRAEDNPMPVALVGRVPVKVTGEGGPITAGDYLTTSSTPGAAMKVTKVGRVIGMALEDWDGSSATVMVQVNNSWSMGEVLGTDGTSTLVTDDVIVSSIGTAAASESTFDSYGLALRGSAWNGSEAEAVEMMLLNVVDATDEYRLSIRNTAETEVAYITNGGTLRIAGDMVIGGRLYPSDRGTPQTDKYIYYDGSSGPAGDFMRTNAKGWSTGSYDFAEMFPSSQSLTSGDIVAFSGSGESVIQATGADGEQLAGIVSTRPGFLAGENVEGAYPIALAGRVPTKVSIENGVIAVGDPLTASSTAGVAMKATEAGHIVGYALESYTGSESDNLILAYVNLGYWSGEPQAVTIIQNEASQAPSGTQNYTALNMSGNIFMATNQILSIGRLEGLGNIWSVEADGTIKTRGSVKIVTDSYQGSPVETVAVTSPEDLITLVGTSTLTEGRAEVRFEDIDPQFNDVVSAIAPIRVIVTPSGPVSLYVSEEDQNHFVVERYIGSKDVRFHWMVTGYRKGYEPEERGEVGSGEDGGGLVGADEDYGVQDGTAEEVPDLTEPDDPTVSMDGTGEPMPDITAAEPEPGADEDPETIANPVEPLIESPTEEDGESGGLSAQ